ncbi:hypothetical protein [Fructilactobacillus florum]|uniref:hypothetical protein n=1 Tax=Fructilactobacillus florum TaxID=640331 RepID=UPI00384D30BF
MFTFFMAVINAVIYISTLNLYIPIAMHFLWNFISSLNLVYLSNIYQLIFLIFIVIVMLIILITKKNET